MRVRTQSVRHWAWQERGSERCERRRAGVTVQGSAAGGLEHSDNKQRMSQLVEGMSLNGRRRMHTEEMD